MKTRISKLKLARLGYVVGSIAVAVSTTMAAAGPFNKWG